MTDPAVESEAGAWRSLFDRRLLAVFFLGMASGYPWVLVGSAMSAWLTELGISRSAIGFVGAVTAAYAINFLWAPLVDRVRLPGHRRLGHRRSWILYMQVLLALLTFSLSAFSPADSLFAVSCLLLAIAFVSATQDVSIDAYRVDLFERSDQQRISHGAAMATAGWWTGYGLLGALPFLVVDHLPGGWQSAYLGLGCLWLVFILVVLVIGRPGVVDHQANAVGEQGLSVWLWRTVVEPFADFFRRNGWQLAVGVIAFVLLFKMGEAFLGRMSIVFYKEVGFTNAEIGEYSKIVNWLVTVVFAIAGSLINARFGVVRGLLVGGVAMASTNLLFALMHQVGPNTDLFLFTVIVDGFTAALGTVAFMSFITFLTSHSFSATQYALLASIGNFGRTTLASTSGWLVDWLDGNWTVFFIVTAIAVLPSLLLLLWLAPKLEQKYPRAFQRRHRAGRQAGPSV